MRLDDEHAYNDRINDIPTIHDHLVPEHLFRLMIERVSAKFGDLKGMYWLIDVVCALNPKEFNEQRTLMLKQITQKIYIAYEDDIPKKRLVALMRKAGCTVVYIAEKLGIARNTAHYYLRRNEDLPTRCIFTYGEYNLMMDFFDCWNELKEMDQF